MSLLAIAALANSSPWTALVVGGGPTPQRNQVAIDNHVDYVARLLPTAMKRRILFADGIRGNSTVQYDENGRQRYRPSRLAHIDGPATANGLESAWHDFVNGGDGPVLLFFAGHGSRNHRGNLDDNFFELWTGSRPFRPGDSADARRQSELTVGDLAKRMALLAPRRTVVLVMSQCYSGSFANLLFEGGRPGAALIDRDFVGFFAATKDRPASGCTAHVNEADYRDFTGFFFAALSGRDRLGNPVANVDYDGNGTVGMDEAYAYASLQPESPDVPTSTADTFLRQFVRTTEDEIGKTPYSSLVAWATPAQRAVLDSLSRILGATGEQRVERIRRKQRILGSLAGDMDETAAARLRFLRTAESVVLSHTLAASGDPALLRRFRRLRSLERRNPLEEAREAPDTGMPPWLYRPDSASRGHQPCAPPSE